VGATAALPAARPAAPDGLAPSVIHPGSGGRAKCWPPDRFEALIERLSAGGHRVLPVLGEVELERWPVPDVTRWRQRHRAEAVGSLDRLCDVLRAARLFIGNDSGPAHLAAWLGVPTVALFGPSDAAQWSPRGPAVRVLVSETGSMEGLSVERVWDAASAWIS
jgi:ADP-heptose:LPS heptosyltransferase